MMRYSSVRGSRASVRKSRFWRRNLWIETSQLGTCYMSTERCRNSLKAIYQTSVWAEIHLFHDILKGDEVFNVEVRFIAKVLGGGIEVDVEA